MNEKYVESAWILHKHGQVKREGEGGSGLLPKGLPCPGLGLVFVLNVIMSCNKYNTLLVINRSLILFFPSCFTKFPAR